MNPAVVIPTPNSDLRVWVLSGCVAILLPVLGWLLARDYLRRDSVDAEVKTLLKTLNDGVAALTLAVVEVRLWSEERFVQRSEHKEDIAALKDDLAAAAARFESEIEKHETRCAALNHAKAKP